jgi:enoyl-CoA hydratase/carnithine racemase
VILEGAGDNFCGGFDFSGGLDHFEGLGEEQERWEEWLVSGS